MKTIEVITGEDKWNRDLTIHGGSSLVCEMAFLSYFPIGIEKYFVYIRTNDGGNIPHMHIYKKGYPSWGSTVKFLSPEYYPHGGKYKDKLSSKLAKELDSMLRSSDPDEDNRTLWQTAIREWNRNNSNRFI